MFLFKGSHLLFGIAIVCMLGTSYFGYLTPGLIYNLSANFQSEPDFYKSLHILLYVLLGIFFTRLVYQLIINKYVKVVLCNIRNECYSVWIESYDLVENKSGKDSHEFPLGDLISRLMNDTQAFRELLTSGTLSIIMNIIFVISCVIGFIKLDVFSGSIISIAQVFATLILLYGSKYMRDIFHKVRSTRAKVAKQMANVTGGFDQIYYLDHKNYASVEGSTVYSEFMETQLKANVWDASYYSVAESLYPLFIILVIAVAPYSNVMEGALIFAIIDLIQRSIEPIKGVAGKIVVIQRALTGLERIKEFYDEVSKKESSSTVEQTNKEINILNFNVNLESFTYPSKNNAKTFTIKDINFDVNPGETVGFVGVSGCGKSTLLKMMAGMILPDQGKIEVETSSGIIQFPNKSLNKGYRELVSLVSQDSHVFSAPLEFNITLGLNKGDFTKFWEDVSSKIKYLSIWGVKPNDIIDLKKISDGQKQLICALRSCYLKKEIVCFDEISSSLDSDLEEALRELVELIQSQALTFIVAHRIETVLKANKIVVLKEGRIVGQGSHQHLSERNNYYQEFLNELDKGQ